VENVCLDYVSSFENNKAGKSYAGDVALGLAIILTAIPATGA
jgi:hypothetical protein